MKAIIEHVALVTRLLGAPVSEAALSAEVVRDKKLNVNYHSLTEVLRSHGFENTLSKRSLEDIPSWPYRCWQSFIMKRLRSLQKSKVRVRIENTISDR